ncbi:BglG family transcription antiterminator [Clostridium omnivorum]|uniref:Transcriptional antiterminator n=1 Tax=Clostridium omnivorum TaxID=1604902 RepID=A0ABQ5N2B5_9CLOT|nr:BglG family transcription antiterminator [Clostridium sp. E14]GLC29330.1 transcriptional antiterminator [Clostridium sp. E14]
MIKERGNKVLNKRQEKIILYMHDNRGWVIGKELAKVLGVSDRTIRSDIANINEFYEDVLIESNIRLGYKMNEDNFQSLDIETCEAIPQTSEERCNYIIKELLFERNEINLTFLQDKVFVSGYSIDNDIKKIKKMIEAYESLKLIRSKNYISLIGKEEQKRKLYRDLLESEIKGNFLNLNKIASFYKDFDLIQVKDILEDTLKEYNYHIRELTFTMIIMHIGIAIERILRFKYIKTERNTDELRNSLEYKIAKVFFEKVAAKIRIRVVEDEVVLLALLLLGKKRTVYTNNLSEIQNNYSIPSILIEIFDDINKTFDVDFSCDNELKNGLEMHLTSLIERCKKNIEIDNLYLQEIKHNYPLVFEMGVRVCELLEEKLHMHISENEIAFIALHLGVAYARANISYKYKVVMIHPRDEGLANLCLQKITNRFGDRMEIVECMSFFEKSAIATLKPDLILTTLPLKHNLRILTEQISLFVNYEDENKIFQALNNLDKIRCHDNFNLLVLKLIKREFFYIHVDAGSPEELIKKMCDNLHEKGYVNESFENSVLQREKMSATSFDYGFATPHSLNETFIKQSALSIAILNRPIKWGSFDVRLVILFAINKDDYKILKIFFDWLSNVISNTEQFARLLEVNDYKEFIDQVLK